MHKYAYVDFIVINKYWMYRSHCYLPTVAYALGDAGRDAAMIMPNAIAICMDTKGFKESTKNNE